MARVARIPLYYGWIVMAITFSVVLVTAGVRSAATIFMVPFEQEFAWTRTAIAGAVSINLFLYGLAGPISGKLVDRYGPKVVMIGSVSALIIGLGGTLFMSSLWHLQLLWGVVVGLGAGGSASVLWASVASRWFVAKRGLVLGILGSANSTGQLIFIPMLGFLVAGFEWRTATVVMMGIALALLVPIAFWMRDDPSDVGKSAYGADTAEGRAAARKEAGPPVGMGEAVRTPVFWLLAASFFVCGGTANGLIGTHLIPHAVEINIGMGLAAATVGVMGGMNFIGSTVSGWLVDRIDPRKVLAAVYLFRGLSLFFLPFVTDFSGLFIFAVIYGLDWFASVPPTVALTARRFGKQSIGTIYGWIFASHQIGAAFSSTMGGVVRDTLGEYSVAFIIGGTMALIGATMALMVDARRPEPVVQPVGQGA
jgi:sugar phosphate permease